MLLIKAVVVFVLGALVGYIFAKSEESGDHIVNQSGNIAGGDIVGRDKIG